jgi:hypothetical protein
MKFNDKVKEIISELNVQSVHLNDSPVRDGNVPNGFYGNINKNGPNQLIDNLWYDKNQRKKQKKKPKREKN